MSECRASFQGFWSAREHIAEVLINKVSAREIHSAQSQLEVAPSVKHGIVRAAYRLRPFAHCVRGGVTCPHNRNP